LRASARGITARDEPIRRGRPPANTATERDIRKTLGIGTSVVQRLLLRHEGFAARIPQFDDVMPC
jgi:hypothetical protein